LIIHYWNSFAPNSPPRRGLELTGWYRWGLATGEVPRRGHAHAQGEEEERRMGEEEGGGSVKFLSQLHVRKGLSLWDKTRGGGAVETPLRDPKPEPTSMEVQEVEETVVAVLTTEWR
jgi:hypothetical protein